MNTRCSKLVGLIGLSLFIANCSGGSGRRAAATVAPQPIDEPATNDWRRVATAADRDRVRRWRDAWMSALPAARRANPQAVAAEGALFDPDHALSDPAPPPGRYRCRVFKLGAARPGGRDFVAYPYFACRVGNEGEVLSLFKETGSQRQVGLLFGDTPSRMVFVGTLVLGDEQRALDYGQDADRDMIGLFERIEERRWRLALPWPRFESRLDVVELVPAR